MSGWNDEKLITGQALLENYYSKNEIDAKLSSNGNTGEGVNSDVYATKSLLDERTLVEKVNVIDPSEFQFEFTYDLYSYNVISNYSLLNSTVETSCNISGVKITTVVEIGDTENDIKATGDYIEEVKYVDSTRCLTLKHFGTPPRSNAEARVIESKTKIPINEYCENSYVSLTDYQTRGLDKITYDSYSGHTINMLKLNGLVLGDSYEFVMSINKSEPTITLFKPLNILGSVNIKQNVNVSGTLTVSNIDVSAKITELDNYINEHGVGLLSTEPGYGLSVASLNINSILTFNLNSAWIVPYNNGDTDHGLNFYMSDIKITSGKLIVNDIDINAKITELENTIAQQQTIINQLISRIEALEQQ